ncbi:MAG: F0F1 ATP synthase subunit B [Bacteroidia bacterium]|jgi:F-type H+-transporting ATPase subunit b
MDLVTPQLGLLVWPALSFLLLLVVLRKFAWKPILDSVNERDAQIRQALDAAKEAREAMVRLQADNEQLMAQARAERDQMLSEAKKTRDHLLSESRSKAEEEAKRLLEMARQDIENERKATMTEVRNLVATLSVDVAEKLLRKELQKDEAQEAYLQEQLRDLQIPAR